MTKKQIDALDWIHSNEAGGCFLLAGRKYVFNYCMVVSLEENVYRVDVTQDVNQEKLLRYMNDAKKGNLVLTLPNAKDLKAAIKEMGAKHGNPHRAVWVDNEGNEHGYNPVFLLDIYNALGIGKQVVEAKVGCESRSPLYIECESGCAMLLPMMKV